LNKTNTIGKRKMVSQVSHMRCRFLWFSDNNNMIYLYYQINLQLVPIVEAYGVERIYLFGSYARGEVMPNSDLDFRVEKGYFQGLHLAGL